jgi:hypothetical protein
VRIPDVGNGNKALVKFIEQTIADCTVSMGDRSMRARRLRQWLALGSSDGSVAMYNKLPGYLDRAAGLIFSPAELRYLLEFDTGQPKEVLAQASVAAKYLTKKVEGCDADVVFNTSLPDALLLGGIVLKCQWTPQGGKVRAIPPWQFGVMRDDVNGLDEQEAMVEINVISKQELWRRILASGIAQPDKVYKAAISDAKRRTNSSDADTYFHQVMIATQGSPVNANGVDTNQPGGLVDLASDPLISNLAPSLPDEMIILYELTVVDDQTKDYTTIQYVNPGIVLAPKLRRKNFFVPQMHPYILVQPGFRTGYFWGKSYLSNLLMLQDKLRERTQDFSRLMAMQYDRLLMFKGNTSITDEAYENFRHAGYISGDPTMDVKDLTPQIPKEAMEEMQFILEAMNDVSGQPATIRGEGDQSVRSNVQAKTLTKTGTPQIRDMSLLVERQCAEMGYKFLKMLAQADATQLAAAEAESDVLGFTLAQLPDDARVVVDSHSTSPVFEEDNMSRAAFLLKAGAIDAMTLLDMVNVPARDLLQARLKDQIEQQQQIQATLMKEAEKLTAAEQAAKNGQNISKITGAKLGQ